MSSLLRSNDDLYAALAPALRPLATRGIAHTYRKNSVLLNEGEAGNSLFVLLKGSVKFFATNASGREITYGTIHAGDYFGEMSLDGGPRAASVMTLEPCTCAVLSHATVSEYLREVPEFAFNLVVHVIARPVRRRRRRAAWRCWTCMAD